MTLLERYQAVLDRLVPELKAQYGDALVTCAVYGSVGRGTPREGSDIDVLVIVRNLPGGRMARGRQFRPVKDRLAHLLAACGPPLFPATLSPILKTPEEAGAGSPLFLDMTEDARLLYDEGEFFGGILERLRRRLSELRSKRIWRGDTWYWDLKPDFKPGEVIEL
jgi:uncharacterized protein